MQAEFLWGNLRNKDYLEDLGLDGRINNISDKEVGCGDELNLPRLKQKVDSGIL
jgi:hypothetical protein